MNALILEDGSALIEGAELLALETSISEVLSSECDSRSVHLWLDRENDLGGGLWRQAADLGWLGLALPTADGGLGLGARGLQLLIRELGRCAAPGPFIPTLCAGQWLAMVGDEAQRAAILPGIVAGEGSVALPAVLERAKPFTLANGAVSGELEVLGSPDAALALVPAGDGGTLGWAFVRVDGATASLEALDPWDRTRDLCRLTCKDAPVVALIDDGHGVSGALLGSWLAIAIAADSLGGADGIAHKTIAYLKERVQFDRPIASFQAIKHRAADLIVRIATQDALLEQAVQALDGKAPDAGMWARLAKAGATDAFAFVAADCIQLHGGVGHTWEYDPHIYVKRARLNEALLGSNRALRDEAVQLLDRALDEGRTTTELDT
jgi:alkylation response protein AidB-like acyl-CoA dehydrogenase